MKIIEDIAALEAHYKTPAAMAFQKVTKDLVPEYRAFIDRARFCALTTVGPEGTDCSPRGDDGPVVRVLDDRTLAMPDWHGNNRLDSLRNIVRDGRVSLMFMVPGATNVIRVNGHARLTADQALCDSFVRGSKTPRTVTLITTSEIYFQCARALIRSELWAGRDDSQGLPTPGEILAAVSKGEVGGETYDRNWPERAKKSMW